jgi:hypothetical protein
MCHPDRKDGAMPERGQMAFALDSSPHSVPFFSSRFIDGPARFLATSERGKIQSFLTAKMRKNRKSKSDSRL